MAVSLSTPDTHECSRSDCDHEYAEPLAVEGSFCSERCATIHRGEKLLTNIRHDHRYCHSCFRQLKEIERPPSEYTLIPGPVDHDALADEAKNCIIGFEYITEHATLGLLDRTRRQDATVDRQDSVHPADELTMSGTVCACGTTDHRDDYVRDEELTSIRAAARRLCTVLEHLGREGQHDKTVNASVLLDAVKQTRDVGTDSGLHWPLAVGRAVTD